MSDKIRWGILGTAAVAEKHFVPSVAELDNSEVVAVASRDAARAAEYAERLGIPRAYGSYDDLLADDDVDAVYLPLPIALHAEWAIRCAEAGKPTLVEKPLAESAESARRIADAFGEAGVPVAEAMMYGFHPLTKRVKQMVADGALGEVRAVNATFCCRTPDPDDFRLKREMGGGATLDVGSYCVSIIRAIAGEEPDDVEATAVFSGEGGVDLRLAGVMRFSSGAVASFVCALTPEFGASYEVFGSAGRIMVPQGTVPNPGDPGLIRYWRDYALEEISTPDADQWALCFGSFADALLKGKPPEPSLEESIANLEVIDRLLAAARSA
jgi:predicted dehydrogenase